jgi:hypothetical protein
VPVPGGWLYVTSVRTVGVSAAFVRDYEVPPLASADGRLVEPPVVAIATIPPRSL